MTPKDELNRPLNPANRLGGAKAASTIVLLAGIWLFITPWVFGAYSQASAWNGWIVGGLIILFSATRIARPAYSTGLGWANMILGIWTFFSPWIYGFVGNQGRFISDLCVGVIVFVLSITAVKIVSGARPMTPISHS